MSTNNNLLLEIEENKVIHRWATAFARHPQQINALHEADAELLPSLEPSRILASTIDTISEEIELKFYQMPETIGKIAATASLSDLAAVGATPIGILVSATLGKLQHYTPQALQEGIASAIETICRYHQTYVLGGDTNFADKTAITVCAIGQVDPKYTLTRKGAAPGDLIYSSGLLGDGAALAAKAFYNLPANLYQETDYQPQARLKEGKLIATFATACMDTSDGLISTLDELSRLNQVGMNLLTPPIELLHTKPRCLAEKLNLPPLAFLAAQHGEFELIFTIPPTKKQMFEETAIHHNFHPILLGEVIQPIGVFFNKKIINSVRIRNLFTEVNGDLKKYLTELLQLTSQLHQ